MVISEKFGVAIRMLRAQFGISQEKLALETNIDRSYIGEIERGTTNVSLEIIQKLASFFGIPISELFKIIENE
ncbi:MAG: helix-turn-helix domain-containing protein [Bacteroidales bacterium]|nr:helix-turn-helix domain-containing protein [Bacteroidales bacterium]